MAIARMAAGSHARVTGLRHVEFLRLVVFGGGWVAGDLDTHDRQARRLAIETGAVVISVDYRRPPESPFPCAFEDCIGAARDVITRINEFGSDAGA